MPAAQMGTEAGDTAVAGSAWAAEGGGFSKPGLSFR
jgi:hypothetical protein